MKSLQYLLPLASDMNELWQRLTLQAVSAPESDLQKNTGCNALKLKTIYSAILVAILYIRDALELM